MADFWTWLENLPLAVHIAETWWFPLLESIHVLTATFLVGSILMVDLRLLGVAARSHPVSRMLAELVPWTLSASAFAVVTGLGLFMTRAGHYAGNRAFQIKMVLLILAGLNMAIFHLISSRGIAGWDTAAKPSSASRLAGGCSLTLWIGVMLAGRWVGHLL